MKPFLQKLTVVPLLLGCAFAAHAENLTPNLKFNGFATAQASVLNNEQAGTYIEDYFGHPGISQHAVNAGLESLAGLQFDYKVNDQVNVVAQLVAQGRNNYDVNAEWAYIGYQINDNLRLRGGHMALPIFMYSDAIHVGQSYPWARLPVEVYSGVPVTALDGMDLLYRQPVGDWNFDAQFLFGGTHTTKFYTNNSTGLNLSLSNNNFTARVGFITSKLTVDALKASSLMPTGLTPPAPAYLPLSVMCAGCVIENARNSFANAGMQYDDGQWFAAGEFARLRVDAWTRSSDSGYLSVGHYIGKHLPYVLLSKTNTVNGDHCAPTFFTCYAPIENKEQATVAIGLKYALNTGVSLKGQVDRVNGFNGTYGFVAAPRPATFPFPPPTQLPSAFYVFTVGLTAVF